MAGKDLLKFSVAVEHVDLQAMAKVMEEGCRGRQ